MKPYRYFKTLAKLTLAGNFTKAILAFLFVTLIPQLLMLLPSKFAISRNMFLIISIAVVFLIIPCFKIGAIGFVSDVISKKDTSMGNIFDGFKYFLKLVPLMLSKLLLIIPFGIIAYITYCNIAPEVIELITEYARNPVGNIGILSSIGDRDYTLMLVFEFNLILALTVSIISSAYFSLTEYILYNEGLSGIKSLIKSIKMMKGHIIYYIGFNLSFIMWHLLSSFTMGASTLILNPYKEAAFILFYNYLRFENGETEIPSHIKEAQIKNESIKEE